ncbi:MAG: hypothetical protein WA399_02970 [Acidobacteriaceae bacterium]
MKTRTVLLISAALELVTGAALVAVPNFVASLLLSAGLTWPGEAVGRLGGLGLFSLAIACWPRGEGDDPQPIRGLLFYNLAAAVYLGYLRFGGGFTSYLLLPACGLHALLGLMLARPAYRSVTDRNPVR